MQFACAYCHLWPAPHYNIFPHYLINGTILEKKLLNTERVFWFSLQLLSETFLILRRNERDMIKKCILVFMWSTLYFCSILMKLAFSRQRFEKSSNIKFHENSSSGTPVVPCGRTVRRTDMTKLIVAFLTVVNAPTNDGKEEMQQ